MDSLATILPHPGLQRTVSPSPSTGVDLSVVIPAYNEVGRLPRALDRLAAWAATLPLDVELLIVDDGSSDTTAAAAAAHPCGCGVLRLRRNSGKGAAVRAGVLAAAGRVIAFTDADLPYRMDAVEDAFATIDAGAADVAYGARDLPTSAMTVRRTARRSLASTSFRMLMGALVSRQVRDTQCGLKAFSRRAAHDIFPRLHTDGFAFDAELILVAHRLGLVAARLPVTLVNEAGSTVSLRRHAPQMLRDVFRARLRHARAAGPKSAVIPPYDVLRRPDIGRDRRRRAA